MHRGVHLEVLVTNISGVTDINVAKRTEMAAKCKMNVT